MYLPIALFLIIFSINIWILYYIYAFIKKVNVSILNIQKRIDNIFSVSSDTPTPNEATKNTIAFDELNDQNMLSIPNDVKFEIEGFDTTPPEYDVKK